MKECQGDLWIALCVISQGVALKPVTSCRNLADKSPLDKITPELETQTGNILTPTPKFKPGINSSV